MSHTPESDSRSPADRSETERKQHVRDWISSRINRWAGRGLAGGLGSTLMALPALSQASVEELYAFQFAETIPGVRSAKLLKNGDVALKMADGRTMIVAAENVQILDSGAIMIAEDAVAEIAQFSLAAEVGGAAAAGGVSGAGAVLGGLGLAGAAAAGGGGGNEEPAPQPVYPDLNLAGLQSAALSSTSTGSTAPAGTANVEVTIGSVVKTVTPNPDGSWDISLTAAEAAGLPQGVTAVTVRNLDGSGDEVSVETANFNVDTIPPTIAITGFSDGAVMNSAEQGTDLTINGTTDAENGQVVVVEMGGQSYLGNVSGGQWSVTVPAADLAALPDATTVTVSADVSDRAGNPAAQDSNSFDTDFTAPTVSLDPVAGGSIELIDVSTDLTLTGTTTAEDGQTVRVSLDGQTYSGTAASGAWSVTIPQTDLSALATGTPALVSVSVEDAAENASIPVSVSVPVDLTGPSISISPLPVGAVLNAAEAGSDLTISGTTDRVGDGQPVTVTLGGQTYSATVSGGGWSVTVPSGDLQALADGSSFSITADVSDADGLIAPQASVPVSTDFTVPVISIDSFSDGPVMNASERGTDLTITGSTTADDGLPVMVSLNGVTYSTSVSGGGWSVTVPASDLAGLPDTSTISVTADVSDTAGNPALQASSSFETDFTAPSLSIISVSDGSVMNTAEQGTDLLVTGTSDAPDGTVVSVAIARSNGTMDVSGTATVSGGSWTFTAPASDLTGLHDSETYTVTASVADAAGNSAQSSTSFDTDFVAPAITIDPLSIGSVLDVAEKDTDLIISGTTTAEDGRTVSVELGGQTYTASASGGTWSTTVAAGDLNALIDGASISVSASVDDAAGNSAPAAATSFTTDFRPVLSLSSVGTNNAISLADAQVSGVTVSGNSVGLSAGQNVDVTLNSTSVGTATVAADGSWSLQVGPSEFAAVQAGDDLNIQAQATVSGGPDPAPASDIATAHIPAAYVITEADRTGSTVTLEIYADPDRDVSGGLAMTAELQFDSTVATYDSGSDSENGAFDLFLASPGVGDTINFAGAATVFSDLSQPLVTFTMTVQDANQPIVLTLTTPDGGPTQVQLGTDGTDSLTAANTDTVLRGGGGDDVIDVSAAGRDIVVFEADPTANGVDTITGFTTGPASSISDALLFRGLNTADLRGNGTDVEILATGGTLGTDTGFVGLTTELSDLTQSTIEAAVESLSGAQAGDEVFVMATDGTDSVLVKVDYATPSSASVETMAVFDGLGDLSNLSADNILHTDPTGASA